jgi:hypothetical protein
MKHVRRRGLGRLLLASFVAVLAWPASGQSAPAPCPVTITTRTVPPDAGFTRAGFNYGGSRLRAHLHWPRGTLSAGILPGGGAMATVMEDGSIWLKLGWWRGLPGKLVITGRRLDRAAPPLDADVPSGYGRTGFVPSGLVFPTTGCWKVEGRLGPARLSFVVKVVKLPTR